MDEERLTVDADEPLRRRRVVVLLRGPLFVPALGVVAVWSVLALLAVVVAWFALLIRGRLPRRLHRFLAAYVRYVGQASAWLHLLSGRYPSVRRARAHPFSVVVPEPLPQPRWLTLLRIPVALPAIVLATVFRVVLAVAAIGAWFVALTRGRTTAGLQELGTFCLRYELEAEAFLLLLVRGYPRVVPPANRAPE